MSVLYTTPPISSWKYQLDPFEVRLIAYDVNGLRICNSQFYIKIAITYDKSSPDIDNDYQTVYSNKDGIILLTFDKQCTVTIKSYMVTNYDESLPSNQYISENNYETQTVCLDYFLPFEPFIEEFTAKYLSQEQIPVNSKIPRKYVQVTLKKSDSSKVTFTIEPEARKDYILTPDYIQLAKETVVTVSYYDDLLDKTWEYDIIVIGKLQELSISAIYKGKKVQLNSLIPKDDIEVTLTLFDGINEIQKVLSLSEWEFAVFPQVTNANLGELTIQYNNLQCSVVIPFEYVIIDYKLDAWYEDVEVKVGEKFVPDKFRIYLINNKTGLRKYLLFNECSIIPSDYVITQEGVNWFTLYYTIDNFLLSDKVAIIGYIDNYSPIEFKVYKFINHDKDFEDVTDMFDNACKIKGERRIKIQNIFNHIIANSLYGKYKLFAPKLTGLSTRHDSEWNFYCFNDKAIKFEFVREIIQEE